MASEPSVACSAGAPCGLAGVVVVVVVVVVVCMAPGAGDVAGFSACLFLL